jgi:hypothetical protein
MAVLFGTGRVNDAASPATSLRIQTSLNGQPIAIVHGQQRIAGNLIWYGGFSGGSGPKGGKGGGGKGESAPSYSADVIIALCEGPIDDVSTVWSDMQVEGAPGSFNFVVFDGTQGQAAWGFMSASFPDETLGYSSLGYVGAAPFSLGSTSSLPQLNFEVRGTISGALSESYTVASPYSFTAQYFSLACSVTEQVTVPPVSPYQVQAQNWSAANAMPVLTQQIDGNNIPGSASQGVVDVNGRVFTSLAVGSTPASGQYTVTSTGLYTFAAADAALQVTIIDLALGPGVSYAATGEPLTQVLGAPGQGEFSLSVQHGAYGQYQFSTADAGQAVLILDVPDAGPAASLTDFLTNPNYGCGFPAANIGNLSQLTNYAYACGLFISPAIVASQAASDYLTDFATGLNGEFVWSAGLLTFVPYGDESLVGFGNTYTPPGSPIYSLDDDDFLKNAGTATIGISAFTSDDPVVCVQKRLSDAYNDIKIEYLDRGNSYNPAIVEAQDDAAINEWGLRPADTKQLHFFCIEQAALTSAQLQLARQQVRNQFSFTVPWHFILLDPMDIVAITDQRLGLTNAWVRILEITENQEDSTLTITAEEYLQGSGSAPILGTQTKLGRNLNVGLVPEGINPPIIFEPPPLVLTAQGNGEFGSPPDGSGHHALKVLQIWMAVSGGNGTSADPNYGGCQVWASFDNITYAQIGKIKGPARQGVLTAALGAPPAYDPDTTDTLSVDLAMSGMELPSANDKDGKRGRTLCYVDGEFIAYGSNTPTGGDNYNLTDLYRGLYGGCGGAHAIGAPFAFLVDDTIFKYNLPAKYVGQPIYFKFRAFNLYHQGLQDLADLTPVIYIPLGNGQSFSDSDFMSVVYNGGSLKLGNIKNPAQNTMLLGDIAGCVSETLSLGSLS